jgi:hypothetical protein
VRRGAAFVAFLALLALGSCATPRPFTEEFYAPLRVRRAAVPATPIAVFAFADLRGLEDPTIVVRVEHADGSSRVEQATAPVGVGIARAFARGLAERGYTVVSTSTTRYVPGVAAPAPIVVTGRVSDFGVSIVRGGLLGASQSRAACRLTVDVWDTATGRRLSERTYQAGTEGAMMPSEPFLVLASLLADAVEHAVGDITLPR